MAVKFITVLVFFYGVLNSAFAQRQQPTPPPRGGGVTPTGVCDRDPQIKISPRDCCDIAYIFDNSTAARCMDKYGQASNVNVGIKGSHDGMECFFACLFNATGAMANGQVNIPALKTSAAATLTKANQTKWLTIVNEAIDSCDQSTKQLSQRIMQSLKGKPIDNQNICSPIPQFMGSCIYFRQIAKCPFKSQPSAQCSQLQDFYQKCPTPPLY